MKKDLFSDTLTHFRSAVETGNLVWFFGGGNFCVVDRASIFVDAVDS